MVDVAAYFWSDRHGARDPGPGKTDAHALRVVARRGKLGPSDRKWREEALKSVPPLVAMLYATNKTNGVVRGEGDVTAIENLAHWTSEVEREFRKRNKLGSATFDDEVTDELSLVELARNESKAQPVGSKRAGTLAAVSHEARQMEQKEDALLGRYAKWLGASEMTPRSAQHEGGRHVEVDGADVMRQRIVEAKAGSGAAYVRMAIGQILDYQRLWTPVNAPAILLPSRPPEDLVELISSLGITLAYETRPEVFTEIEPKGSLPDAVRGGKRPIA